MQNIKPTSTKLEKRNFYFENMQHLLVTLAFCLLCCSCVWNDTDEDLDYLVMDDSEYPYAEIPRIVIETEHFQQIRDRETQIPARLQIYGKDRPESSITELRIKGRGNSSFSGMPKSSIKLSFEEKFSLFGMPANKDWALIANFADRSMLKNYISFKLFDWLGASYSPRCYFVELYLNRSYQGVYLLTETIKQGESRVHIPNDGNHFLIELDDKSDNDDIVYKGKGQIPLNVHFPKQIDSTSKEILMTFMNGWETYLSNENFLGSNYFDNWINIEDYLRFYWLQEFSENSDAYGSSTFFTWSKNSTIHMGPVWDMDLAYGSVQGNLTPYGWEHTSHGWNAHIWKDPKFRELSKQYWIEHRNIFQQATDSIAVYSSFLKKAAINEFKRWPTLKNDETWTFPEKYNSYNDASVALKTWMQKRIEWIDNHL